jgi:hypothetical protein
METDESILTGRDTEELHVWPVNVPYNTCLVYVSQQFQ